MHTESHFSISFPLYARVLTPRLLCCLTLFHLLSANFPDSVVCVWMFDNVNYNTQGNNDRGCRFNVIKFPS